MIQPVQKATLHPADCSVDCRDSILLDCEMAARFAVEKLFDSDNRSMTRAVTIDFVFDGQPWLLLAFQGFNEPRIQRGEAERGHWHADYSHSTEIPGGLRVTYDVEPGEM